MHKHAKKAALIHVKSHRVPAHEILHAFDIQSATFELIKPYCHSPKCCPWFSTHIVANKEEAVLAASNLQGHIAIFSDGSDQGRQTGVATVLYKDGEEKRSLRNHLGSTEQHTVFKAKLLGLVLTAQLIVSEWYTQSVMIGADSQAAIQEIGLIRGKLGHYLADHMLDQLETIQNRHSSIEITLAWTPGHSGIEGNKCMDEEAKKVAHSESSPQ